MLTQAQPEGSSRIVLVHAMAAEPPKEADPDPLQGFHAVAELMEFDDPETAEGILMSVLPAFQVCFLVACS